MSPYNEAERAKVVELAYKTADAMLEQRRRTR